MRLIPAFLLPVFLLLCPALALAQTAATPSLGGSVVQMLLGLFAVLAMLVGGLWLLKRLSGHQGTHNNLVRIVGGATLGTRERIVVVEMGQTWLVLGVTPTNINTLAEMPRQALPPAADIGADMPRWLKKMLDKKNARQTP